METNLLDIINKGGIVSWILVALSIVTLALIIFKLFHFLVARPNNTRPIQNALKHVSNNQDEVAIKVLHRSNSPAAVVLHDSLEMINKNYNHESIRENTRQTGNMQLARLRATLSWLDTIAVIAPLLGLLGTVVGMVKAFQKLEGAGADINISMLAGGIWEALITTAIGLIVAIVALIAVNAFEGRVERARESMEIAVRKLFQIANINV
jgi:biopolymer transport protein ExbB